MSRQGAFPSVMAGIGVELDARQRLACLLRVLACEGWSENIGGHITVDVADGSGDLWVNPWGIWWEEVRAADILRVRLDGTVVEGRWDVTPAIFLHTELHRRRPDARVLVHNHPYHATLLAALGERPRFLHQNSCLFHGDLATVDEYAGTVEDRSAGEQFADWVGSASGVVLANHGAIVIGSTVEEAAYRAVVLERMCRFTVDALRCGHPGREVDEAARPALRAELLRNGPAAYWDGAVRRLLAREPDVLDERV